jgi:hypothetical protein
LGFSLLLLRFVSEGFSKAEPATIAHFLTPAAFFSRSSSKKHPSSRARSCFNWVFGIEIFLKYLIERVVHRCFDRIEAVVEPISVDPLEAITLQSVLLCPCWVLQRVLLRHEGSSMGAAALDVAL